MKSIFKKLAFVLALAMVVTMLPAKSAAAAAKGPQLKAHRVLYLNEGGDVTGTYLNKAYATVWNFKEDGYTVKFESKNPEIATVGKNKGMVTAVSVGKTEVTATFSKKGAADVVKTCKVEVKKNAAVVTVDEDSQKKLGELTVGEKFTAVAVKTDADGSNEDITDGVRFAVADEAVATVNAKTGEITAVAAGKTELTVWGVQWEYSMTEKKYVLTKTTPETPYELVVKVADPIVTGATVKSVTKIELAVEGVTAENVKNLKITNEFGGDIKTLFKDPVLSEDGKTVTVEKYVNLVNDEKLNFAFGDEEPYQLTVKIGEVASIVLVGPSAVVVGAEPEKIDVRVLDANGVELDVDLNKITFKVSDETFAYTNEGKISIFQVGKTVTLEATYNTGKFDDKWNLIELKSNQIAVTGVEAATIVAQEMLFNREDKDYSSNPVKIYSNETGKAGDLAAVRLFAQVMLSDKDKTKVTSAIGLGSGFSFETLDPSVLLVDAATGTLAPVKTGTARVLVKFEQGNAKMNGVATVQVLDARKLVNVVPDRQTIAISNAAAVESATITFTGKDQYGQDWGATIDEITCLVKPTKAVDLVWDAGTGVGTNKLTVTGALQVAGTYNYRVTFKDGANNKASAVVSIVVKQPSSTNAASYKFVAVGGNVEVDPSKITDDSFANYQFRVVAQDNAGVAFAVVTDALKELTVKIGNTEYKDITSNNGIYTVNFATTGSAITVSGSAVTVSDLHGNEGNVVANDKGYTVGEGDFVITGKLTVNGTDRVIIPLTGNIKVKKGAPSVSANTAVLTKVSVGSELAAIRNVLKTNEGKYTVLDLENGDVVNTNIGNGTSYVLVKSVKVAEDLGNGKFVIHTVNINQYFSVTIE